MDNINPVPEELKFTPFPEQPPPSKRTKYSLVIFFTIIFILLFAVVMFFLLRGNMDKIRSLTHLKADMLVITQSNSVDISEARTTLYSLLRELNMDENIEAFRYNDWVLPEKSKTFIKGYTFSIEKSGTPSASLIESLDSTSRQFFLIKGFKINITNSVDFNQNESLKTGKVTFTNAYEKGGLFCVTSFDDSIEAFAVFYCGVIDEEQNYLQKTIGRELSPLLNPTNDPAVLVLIEKQDGDYAVGVVNYAEENNILLFYAKKIKNKWEIIEKSKLGISCEKARKYNFPVELRANCIN
jgi:hypothetical protein